MYKNLRYAFVALLATITSFAYAQTTVTFTAGTDKGTTTQKGSPDKVEKENVVIDCTDAAFATKEYRIYHKSTLTISAQGKITKIEFKCAAVGGKYTGKGFDAVEGLEVVSDEITTWTGNAQAVTLTANVAQVRAKEIIVTYTPDASAVAAPTITGEESFYPTTQVTIMAATGAKIYYNLEGQDPDERDTEYTAPFTLNKTTTVKAVAVLNGKTSPVATKVFNLNDPNAKGALKNPYTVTEALAALSAGTAPAEEVHVVGFISQIKEVELTKYFNATYSISTDGTTNNELVVFRGYSLNGEKFKAADEIEVGDQVVVLGKLINYKDKEGVTTPEIAQNNKIIEIKKKATGISAIENKKAEDNAAIYNLAGQRVDENYKGIVIQNGKKFVK